MATESPINIANARNKLVKVTCVNTFYFEYEKGLVLLDFLISGSRPRANPIKEI